jgi:hypothetical protein
VLGLVLVGSPANAQRRGLALAELLFSALADLGSAICVAPGGGVNANIASSILGGVSQTRSAMNCGCVGSPRVVNTILSGTGLSPFSDSGRDFAPSRTMGRAS